MELNRKLAANGTNISYDPLETSLPIKIFKNYLSSLFSLMQLGNGHLEKTFINTRAVLLLMKETGNFREVKVGCFFRRFAWLQE
jgi:hypothetical protein